MTGKERELFTQALKLITELDKDGTVLEMGLILEMREALAQPEQEPVAQIRVKNGYWIDTARATVKHLPDGLHDLYTAPPRKAWVGLTNEELVELRETHEAYIFQLMFAVEAKVREKNDGSI